MKLRAIAKVVVFEGIAYQTSLFNKAVYLGDPVNVCNILSDQGCQELVLLFVRTAPSLKFVSDVLSVCRSPVSVGGVGKGIEEFAEIIASGAEKIVLSDSLWDGSDKPQILCKRFGRQAIAASVDYVELQGRRIVVTGNQRRTQLGPLEEILPRLQQDFLGEVVLNNISRDGQATGLDYGVMALARSRIQELPVLLSGGYHGEPFEEGEYVPDGFISGTHFSLFGKHNAALVNYPINFSVNNV